MYKPSVIIQVGVGVCVCVRERLRDWERFWNLRSSFLLCMTFNFLVGRFTNIVARWPGSTHDSHVFRMSGIRQTIEEKFHSINDGVVLGDSGYACKPFLMTPYLRPSTPAHERFNSAHSRTRVTIERAFGWWKRRFHVLHAEIRMTPERVCTVIGTVQI